tara:strand:+ start:659 stop:874 length:216 start_codon:yes stop_codon:yes gene_type:complete
MNNQKIYKWDYKESVNCDELLKRMFKLIDEPVSNLFEMEGDMFMSDMRKLATLRWKLATIISEMNREKRTE